MKYCIHFQELNEQIAHLKDQLQELKAKTGLEEKFLKKSTQVELRCLAISDHYVLYLCRQQ